jgi:hypothetical protein
MIAKILDDQSSAMSSLDMITISAGDRSWGLTVPEDEGITILENVGRRCVTSLNTLLHHWL